MTVKLLVSLSGGMPLSVTRTVMTLVLGPCASVGVQLKTPVAGLTVALPGADTSDNVSISIAMLVTVKVASSLIVCVGGTLRVGGLLLAVVLEGEVENSTEPNTISELVVD